MMTAHAGVVLTGGRSSRMGTSKAALEWRGGTLLHRTVSVLADVTGRPVVVVRAAGQLLPPLPDGTVLVEDPREGRGPLQGIAAGLAALAPAGAGPGGGTRAGGASQAPASAGAASADAAFVAATDMPFLAPAFVRRVLEVLAEDGTDVALPVARGHAQPLAAAYRVALAPRADRLVASGLLRPADLFAACAVTRLDEARLLAGAELAAADPCLDSLVNVNNPAEYAAARARAGF